jgi:hypothetical protein
LEAVRLDPFDVERVGDAVNDACADTGNFVLPMDWKGPKDAVVVPEAAVAWKAFPNHPYHETMLGAKQLMEEEMLTKMRMPQIDSWKAGPWERDVLPVLPWQQDVQMLPPCRQDCPWVSLTWTTPKKTLGTMQLLLGDIERSPRLDS